MSFLSDSYAEISTSSAITYYTSISSFIPIYTLKVFTESCLYIDHSLIYITAPMIYWLANLGLSKIDLLLRISSFVFPLFYPAPGKISVAQYFPHELMPLYATGHMNIRSLSNQIAAE